MKIEYIAHKGEDGLFWAEIPSMPGCLPDGRTMEDLARNVQEAVECTLESYATLPPGACREQFGVVHPSSDGGTISVLDLRFAPFTPSKRSRTRRREAAYA